VNWLGMPNILANREVVREFLQEAARPAAIAAEVGRLLDDPAARGKLQVDLARVISLLGERGAAERAADAILNEIS
jgi:lipid-A-disaccharide synthase